MKTSTTKLILGPVALVMTLSLAVVAQEAGEPKEPPAPKVYCAVEMQGKMIGYSEESEYEATYEGSKVTAVRQKVFIKLSLLGAPVDQTVETEVLLDPRSQSPLFCTSSMEVGPTTRKTECAFEKTKAHCKVFLNEELGDEKDIELAPDVLIHWGNRFLASAAPSLAGDIPGEPRKLKLFVPMLLELTDGTIVFEGEDRIKVRGEERPTRRYSLTMTIQRMKVKSKFWVLSDQERIVRTEVPAQGLLVYETDANIATTLKRAEITDTLLAQTNEQIDDFASLTRMKLEAEIAAPGEELSVASLNVPGQTFEGTVGEDNAIKGIFEIAPVRYDGAAAPPFPPDFGDAVGVAKYLEPEAVIESDHPDIVALAQEVTKDAPDSWQAAVKLAEWVHTNIGGDIPGGVTALGTLKAREAECGGHSRLHVALCRAVGIPARVVAGAMYTPIYGGSFGQHGWAEVYMGEQAGWIPIDATAGETDYVDAGHIRLGEAVRFMPKKIKVLEYEPKQTVSIAQPQARPAPCAIGRPHTFHYVLNGDELGREVFKIEKIGKHEGQDAFFLTSQLALKGVEGTRVTIMALDGRPLYYRSEGKAGQRQWEVECKFDQNEVKATVVQGDTRTERTVSLPENILTLDSNSLGLFAMMLSRFELETGQEFTIRGFHPSSLSVLPLQVKVGQLERVSVRGKEYDAYNLKIGVAGQQINMFISQEGMLIKDVERGGKLVVEYDPPAD